MFLDIYFSKMEPEAYLEGSWMFIFKNTTNFITSEGFQILTFKNEEHNLVDLLLEADSKVRFGSCFYK
jgi:hypothetical protein